MAYATHDLGPESERAARGQRRRKKKSRATPARSATARRRLMLEVLEDRQLLSGGGANMLLVVNPADENALRIANAYQQLRGIPDSNIVFITPPMSNGTYKFELTKAEFNTLYVAPLANAIATRGLSGQIDYIATLGQPSRYISTTDRNSLTYGLSLLTPINAGLDSDKTYSISTALYQNPNSIPIGSNPAIYHSQHYNVTYGSAGVVDTQYYMSGAVAYTWVGGSSADQVIANLQRAAAADGTHPTGTIYFEENDDIRSDTREWEWPATKTQLDARGVPWLQERLVSGATPLNRTNVLGAVIGQAGQVQPNGSTYLAGSWADNLTSYGAYWDDRGQTKDTMILATGAAATTGSVIEPYAISNRFTNSSVHVFLADGSTAGEAFAKSVATPDIQLFMGDLLAQPQADLPQVTLTGWPAEGATVNGTLALQSSAALVSPKIATGIKQLELLVDGRIVSSASVGSTTFNLDTRTLTDGRHELRVVAVNNAAAESEAYVSRNVLVNNLGRAVTAPGGNIVVSGSPTTPVAVSATTGTGTLTRIELRHLGRTLGQIVTANGNINVTTAQLAYGDNRLTPVAVFSDGTEVAGNPITLQRNPIYLAGTTPTPAGSRVAGIRGEYFYGKGDVSIAASNYSGTPDAVVTYASMNLSSDVTHLDRTVTPMPTTAIDKLAARFTASFNVTAGNTGEYNFFLWKTNDSAQVLVDGVQVAGFDALHNAATTTNGNGVFLGVGEHRLTLLTSNTVTTTNAGYYDVSLEYRGPDGVTRVVDSTSFYEAPPTITDGNLSISGATGTGGAFRVGDTITATWNNTAAGDNNLRPLSAVTFNFSQFGGGTAVPAANASNVWTASFAITAGTLDAINRNVSLTATDLNGTATTADTSNATVDNQAPTLTDAKITITSTGSGTGGIYRIGDVLTVRWDNTAAGDNNADALAATNPVTVNFSQFGGGAAVAATNAGGIWTANYTLTAGSIDAAGRNATLTVTDNAGNATTTADTSGLSVDNVAPTLTDARITITSTGTGAGGVYKPGDTVSVRWDNTAAGDNNADALAAGTPVTVDFSQFGGGAAVAATNAGGIWTASYTLVAGVLEATRRNVLLTVIDNAGNATTTADTTNLALDTRAPSVSSATASTAIITDSNVGTAAFWLTLVFDENMSASPAPVVSFPGVVPTGTLTFNAASSSWSNATTYVARFDVSDANVVLPAVDIRVAGATDAAGNQQAARDFSARFGVETENPAVASINVNQTLVADAQVGGPFIVSLTYSEPMNVAAGPTLDFSPTVGSTLSWASGSWLDATHYAAVYNTADANLVLSGVDITVSGARDAAGNSQIANTAVNAFDINTYNPVVSSLTAGVEPAAGNNFDFEGGQLSPWSTLGAGAAPGPYQLAPFDVGGTGRVSAAFRLAPNLGALDGVSQTVPLTAGVTYTFAASVAEANESLSPAHGIDNASLLVDGTPVATFDFQAAWGDLGAGGVQRATLRGQFTPATSGAHTLAIAFQRAGAEASTLWAYADDVLLGRDAGTLVNDALSGGRLSLTAAYAAPMDTGVAPQIGFTPALAGTLAFDAAHSGWTNNTTYVARYAIADANTTIAQVDVSVSGAQLPIGNAQTPRTTAAVLRVDTQNPAVTVDTLMTANRLPTLTGSIADVGAGGGIAGVTVRVAGQTLAATLQGNTWSATLTSPLADNTYDVQATVSDNAGNTTLDASTGELIIDAVAPVVTVNRLTTNNSRPRLTGSVYDPAPGSAIKTLSVTVWGRNLLATVSGNTWSVDVPTTLADGVYEVQASAVDNAGNSASDATSTELLVDTAPATATVNALITRNRRPTLSGTLTDRSPGSGAAGLTVSVNGQDLPVTLSGSAWTASVLTDLADGVYDVRATGRDAAGNSGLDGTTGELTIDTTPPNVTVTFTKTAAAAVTLTGTAIDPGASGGVAAVMVTVIGQNYQATLNGNVWSATLPTPADDGLYDVQVMAVDRVGNSGLDGTLGDLAVDRAIPSVATLSAWQPESLGGNFNFEHGDLSAWTPLNAGDQPGPYQVAAFDVSGSGRASAAFRLAPNAGVDDGLSRSIWLEAGTTYILDAAVAERNDGGYANSGVDQAKLLIDGTVVSAFSFTEAVGLLPAGQTYRAALHGTYVPTSTGMHTLSLTFWRRFAELQELWAYADDVSIAQSSTMSLRTADVGATVEVLATYSEPMDPSQTPRLSLTPNVQWVLRFDAAASHWANATTYVGVYQVAAAAPIAPHVAVIVADAQDTSHNVQTARTVAERFDVATTALRPTSCGVYDPVESKFYLKYTNREGFADAMFGFGTPGWKPLSGDWNGDGVDTIGLFQPAAAHFYLRNTNSSGPADLDFGYGDPAQSAQYVLVMGDWDGDGIDTIGLYHKASATWFLRNTNSEGTADLAFGFGAPGSNWAPLVGDWDGDGIDTIGLYDPATGMFYLRNSHTTGMADIAFPYGAIGAGWTPLIGDWDGDGRESAGFYQPGSASHFYLRNQFTPGSADVNFGLGFAGVQPIVGNWSATAGLGLTVESGKPTAESGKADALVLAPQSLAPLLSEALARWTAVGVSIARPPVVVTDLPGNQLGEALGNTLYLDRDAAGHGWFSDSTPATDEEFARLGSASQLQAVDPRAVDRIDLLTVVEHELGHLAGLPDLDASLESLMSGSLRPGLRRNAEGL